MTLNKLFIFLTSFIFIFSTNYSLAQEIVFTKGDTLDCKQKICQYKDIEEQGKYEEAVAQWKEAYLKYRTLNKRLFIHGFDYIGKRIENESGRNKKFFIDSLMCFYEERIKIYGQEGFVRGRQGVDLFCYDNERLEESHKLLKNSIEIQGAKSEPAVVLCYMQSAIGLFVNDNIEISKLDSIYLLCDTILKKQLNDSLTDTVQVNMAISAVNKIYERFLPRENCDHLLPIIHSRLEKKEMKENEFIQLLRFIEVLNCKDLDIYNKIIDKVNKIRLGKINNSLQKRIQEIEKVPDSAYRAKKYFRLSLIFKAHKQYDEAIKFVNKSISLDIDNLFYYNCLTNLYLKIHSERKHSSKFGIYWIIVDKLNKIPKDNRRKGKEINHLIKEYSQNFPTKEQLEKHGLKPGDEYYIGGWINETTIVRAKE